MAVNGRRGDRQRRSAIRHDKGWQGEIQKRLSYGGLMIALNNNRRRP
jgi:hypothetical protein